MIRILLVILVLFPSSFVGAQDASEFTIRVFGSSDTEAPTTPTAVNVTPQAVDQIAVSWSSSTDNFAVFGYVVSRDSVPIATTTTTSFVDSGLAPETTYGYSISAFDVARNYSTSTTLLATTTLSSPPPPVVIATSASENVDATRLNPQVENLSILTGIATASISVQTSQLAKIDIRYGTTRSLETAIVVGEKYRRDHEILIGDLEPGRQYYFEITGYTNRGAVAFTRQGTFTTLSNQPPPPPENVRITASEQRGDGVWIRFSIPDIGEEFGSVRVVRNPFRFPESLNDGVVIYEGVDSTVFDQTAFLSTDTVFYTIFLRDVDGRTSSGAVLRMKDVRSVLSDDTESLSEPVFTLGSTSDATTTPREPVIPVGFPSLTAFTVTQQEAIQVFSTSTPLVLESDELFIVSIEADEIVGEFKSLVATLTDPRNPARSFSFLLRLNEDASAFTAAISSVRAAGISRLQVEVYDREARVVGSYETSVVFLEPNIPSSTIEKWFWRTQTVVWLLVVLLPVMLFGYIIYLVRSREHDEDNQSPH